MTLHAFPKFVLLYVFDFLMLTKWWKDVEDIQLDVDSIEQQIVL